jgi:hypothetical protein
MVEMEAKSAAKMAMEEDITEGKKSQLCSKISFKKSSPTFFLFYMYCKLS